MRNGLVAQASAPNSNGGDREALIREAVREAVHERLRELIDEGLIRDNGDGTFSPTPAAEDGPEEG
jgi:hypothetical protein